MPQYRNPHDHPVDLHDGRTLEPGAEGDTTKKRAEELDLEPVGGTRDQEDS